MSLEAIKQEYGREVECTYCGHYNTQAPSVPDGYALAPMEPNAAMLEAGYNAGPCWDVRHVRRIYLAMLAASDA